MEKGGENNMSEWLDAPYKNVLFISPKNKAVGVGDLVDYELVELARVRLHVPQVKWKIGGWPADVEHFDMHLKMIPLRRNRGEHT